MDFYYPNFGNDMWRIMGKNRQNSASIASPPHPAPIPSPSTKKPPPTGGCSWRLGCCKTRYFAQDIYLILFFSYISTTFAEHCLEQIMYGYLKRASFP